MDFIENWEQAISLVLLSKHKEDQKQWITYKRMQTCLQELAFADLSNEYDEYGMIFFSENVLKDP